MSFKTMKRNRKKSLERILDQSEKMAQGNSQSYTDDRIWKAATDKTGNGYAVIRFLPEPEGEETPWVEKFTHGFKGKSGWYIENCPTSLKGQTKCPVCEENNKLWNTEIEANQNIARNRKRRREFYSNILVVKDPANPENEGNVFLFKYGKKIWDKLSESMAPEFDDDVPVNPFDMFEGANFKLKVRRVAGFPNYDASDFDNVSEVADGDEGEMEAIYNKLYSLKELVDVSNFKPYDELKSRLEVVLGNETTDDEDKEESAPAPEPKAKKPAAAKTAEEDDGDDDNLEFFKSLTDDED
tara:strand:+ start:12102 stop:12995 length:894 start_codon:yes stop_codon:yes gene_type:complete